MRFRASFILKNTKQAFWHVFVFTKFKKQAFCYFFAFKIIKKMRFRAYFILKKCKTSILTHFRFCKIQNTSVLLLFFLKKDVHWSPRFQSFFTKSSFRAFFRQESFPGVHIVVRDTLVTFLKKKIIIGRFRTFPAEIGRSKFWRYSNFLKF